ncbi:deoxyribose-phosphate aldolase [Enterococcus phoeniculicola]|jgi:deoxyribose-phosphate aldolase|uniref:Deoxyribose-phosphate aldolase n=1 Tax=Enterococcus phoeniculicola ATCC BAA-412 TaxID=1158610 RepID=R3WNM6_9ENTE|nr:deoxyribose-phosphate aldolase [Enterococcus phoeniculicola]EOL49441.1 deoxyribose-phosphate aldolase [Enterococcus phoeniculicola ATCC BAA-412]EOT71387.1 deoxyribose-phosphate aldolase [Enterococcus phoeniculicola ATCC BAA-412]OJG69581.1 deoxyribose-phosphate aldolase [Enterococcus phoeniculicola]
MSFDLSVEEFAKLVDHTLLRADAREEEFKQLCKEADDYGFKMVAINSSPVGLCREFLKTSSVHVGAAIGFPLGQTTIATKVFEVKDSIKNGADEIDYVINIGELKNGNVEYIRQEMKEIVELSRKNNILSKVILENCYLTDEEKITVCEIAKEIKPDFVKTSTGFGTSGATVEDVKLMKSIVGNDVKVKAAGGIRDLETAKSMVEAGAERLGTSSGIKIIEEYKALV